LSSLSLTRQRPAAWLLAILLGFASSAVLAQHEPASEGVTVLGGVSAEAEGEHGAAADEHAAVEEQHGGTSGEHGAAEVEHGGGHEVESELAVEHGSWFYPIAKAVNSAVGFKLISGYTIVSWLIIGGLLGLSLAGTAKIRSGAPDRHQPKGLQNFLEMVVEGLYGFTEGIIGPGGRKYAPLIATFFIYILLNNYIAVIPGFVAPTSTLNMTLALGFTAFCFVQYYAIRQNGLLGWLSHFAGSPKKGDLISILLAPLMFVLEIIGEMVKPLSLSMRLFGNIFGEDTVVIQLALFALGLGGWKIVHGHVVEQGAMWAAFIPLQLPMMAFALFGGLIQALVFSMLVCIYISLLTSHEHEGHDDGHDEHGSGHH